MCTLACWIGTHPRAPLVVAANRDERLGRASTGPLVWPGSIRLVAPRDDVAGGSWWAINEHGLFVALTNRAGANVDPERHSRGQLVIEVARSPDLRAAEELVRRLRATDYNGFHLLVTDGRAGLLAVDDAKRLEVTRLGAGFHVVTERSFEAGPVSRDARVREQLDGTFPDVDELQIRLGEHDPDPFQSLCVHLPGIDYGTRSSTVVALGGPSPTLRFAPGAPCVTAWEDRTELLKEIGLA